MVNNGSYLSYCYYEGIFTPLGCYPISMGIIPMTVLLETNKRHVTPFEPLSSASISVSIIVKMAFAIMSS